MRIFDLEESIRGFETDYKTASAENKTLLLRLINSKQETINRLLDEKKAPSRGTVIGSSGNLIVYDTGICRPISVLYSLSFLSGHNDSSAPSLLRRSFIRILGDDVTGPHSTATIIGPKLLIGCAHSLDRTPVTTTGKRSSRGVVKCTQYLESYWVQIRGTKTKDREFTDQGRVPVKLLKSHEEKDWALFWRDDGKEFPAEDIAQIDRNMNDQNLVQLGDGCLIHCPVSLLRHMSRAGQFNIGAHMTRNTNPIIMFVTPPRTPLVARRAVLSLFIPLAF
jgi:hypothetical protein